MGLAERRAAKDFQTTCPLAMWGIYLSMVW